MSIQLVIRAGVLAFRAYGAYKFIRGEGPLHALETTRLVRVGRSSGTPFQTKLSNRNRRARRAKKSRKRKT